MTDQTGGVELLLAGPTREARQLKVGSVKDGETDHAVVHALEALVDVPPPDPQTVHNAAVLQQAPTVRQYTNFYNVHRGKHHLGVYFVIFATMDMYTLHIFFMLCLCFKWLSF